MSSWAGRAAALRDRLLASPRFRDWATRFPPTRPIARRRTRGLFDLCAGFVYSQILLACVQLGLFDLLAEGPATIPDLAPRLDLSPEAAERLLAAATALRLVRRRGPRYGLGPLGAAMVGNGAALAMVRHHALLYADLADPVALLRAGRGSALPAYWEYAGDGAATAGGVAGYTTLMAESQGMVAAAVLDAYDIRRHRHLLDVGGGDGSFLRAAGARAPSLRLTLFDLPPVAVRARLPAGAAIVGGDFRTNTLPEGADLVTLVRVVHDHDEATALDLLRAVRAALVPGGRLLLAEPMAETPGAEPAGDAYFGMYLLAMGQGRPRSAPVLAAMLRVAGFAHCRLVATHSPLLVRIIVAW